MPLACKALEKITFCGIIDDVEFLLGFSCPKYECAKFL